MIVKIHGRRSRKARPIDVSQGSRFIGPGLPGNVVARPPVYGVGVAQGLAIADTVVAPGVAVDRTARASVRRAPVRKDAGSACLFPAAPRRQPPGLSSRSVSWGFSPVAQGGGRSFFFDDPLGLLL